MDNQSTAAEKVMDHISEHPPTAVGITSDGGAPASAAGGRERAAGAEESGGGKISGTEDRPPGSEQNAAPAEAVESADKTEAEADNKSAPAEAVESADKTEDYPANSRPTEANPDAPPAEVTSTVVDSAVVDEGAADITNFPLGRARVIPEYDAADQFETLEGQTFLAMPVQVPPSPEAALRVAVELAERTQIVETASAAGGAPAPIIAAPLQAVPIREAAIQIIQTGKSPFPPKPKPEDETAVAASAAGRESGREGGQNAEKKNGSADSAAFSGAAEDEVKIPLAAPLGNPLEPGRRAIAPVSAEKTFMAQPLAVDGTWYEDSRLAEEYDRLEDEPEEAEIEIEVEAGDEQWETVEETVEEGGGPARVIPPVAPEPAPSLNIPAEEGVACFSPNLMKIPNLKAFLGHEVISQPNSNLGVGAVITWGGKDNLAARRAMMFAKKYNLPLWRLEDGFLRSLELGARGAAPMSLVADRAGIYYDANRPSDLENLLNSTGWETPELLAAAEKAIRLIKEESLSKYNCGRPAPEGTITGGKRNRRRILVLDQTRGDLSVSLGLGGPETFMAMLKAARYEHPGEEFFIKTHPEVIAGRKQGYFDLRRQTGLTVIAEDYSPLSLIAQADEVYTVSSQMGLEALFLDKPVHCFGLPFYSGWGLTQDRLATARRVRPRTLPELFAATYILYPRYVNPITGRPADIFEIIRLLTDQRRHNNATRGYWAISGFSFWKRDHARAFFSATEGRMNFALTPGHARFLARRKHGRIASWGAEFHNAGDDSETPEVINVEDGFLRSVGLGSNFQPPYSLILDPEGLYYDHSRPSRLEQILKSFDFNEHPELVLRAEKLIQAIVGRGLSKYNHVGERRLNFKPPQGRRVIVVPGQVETDASVTLSSPELATNAALLAEVRQRRPDGFIIYKPHPDVENGNRLGEVPDHLAAKLADKVVSGVELAAVLPLADEVHTLTSLVGFEALIRGIETHTYGGPFYAGWKLTHDRLEFPRRGRRLTINELVAGTLILYPTYYDWRTGLFCGPEEIVHILSREEEEPPSLKIKFFLTVRDLARKWSKGKYGGPR